MNKCEECGKEFKTGQALSGHRRWVHGTRAKQSSLFPSKRFITDEELNLALKKIESLIEVVNANATTQVELSKIVVALLIANYKPGQIQIDYLAEPFKSQVKAALAAK